MFSIACKAMVFFNGILFKDTPITKWAVGMTVVIWLLIMERFDRSGEESKKKYDENKELDEKINALKMGKRMSFIYLLI